MTEFEDRYETAVVEMLKQKQAGMPPKKEAAVAHVAPPQEGPGGAQPPDPSSGRSDSSEAPERSALGSVSRNHRRLAPSKSVVDAELYSREPLFDIDPWDHFWHTADCPGECYIARAKVVEIVLKLC